MPRPEQLTLTEAVAEHVRVGSTVYLGNFGAQLFSVGHEMIRQGCTSVHLVMGSGGILLDQLLGAGVRAATFAHCWSPVGPAPASCFRRLVESGGTGATLHEVSLGTFTAALTAGAWGVPFMPVPELHGTGYADADWAGGTTARVRSRFGDVSVVQALAPDVAFVHVDAVTPWGDGVMRSPRGETVVAAQASRSVVVVAEELTEDPPDPASVAIPGLLVDAVVIAPGAVHPDGCAGRYERDVPFYEAYAEAGRTPDGFRRWLERWVHDVPSHDAYRRSVGRA